MCLCVASSRAPAEDTLNGKTHSCSICIPQWTRTTSTHVLFCFSLSFVRPLFTAAISLYTPRHTQLGARKDCEWPEASDCGSPPSCGRILSGFLVLEWRDYACAAMKSRKSNFCQLPTESVFQSVFDRTRQLLASSWSRWNQQATVWLGRNRGRDCEPRCWLRMMSCVSF